MHLPHSPLLQGVQRLANGHGDSTPDSDLQTTLREIAWLHQHKGQTKNPEAKKKKTNREPIQPRKVASPVSTLPPVSASPQKNHPVSIQVQAMVHTEPGTPVLPVSEAGIVASSRHVLRSDPVVVLDDVMRRPTGCSTSTLTNGPCLPPATVTAQTADSSLILRSISTSEEVLVPTGLPTELSQLTQALSPLQDVTGPNRSSLPYGETSRRSRPISTSDNDYATDIDSISCSSTEKARPTRRSTRQKPPTAARHKLTSPTSGKRDERPRAPNATIDY